MKATAQAPNLPNLAVDAAIETFVAGCQAIIDRAQSEPGFPEALRRTLTVQRGPRYARVMYVERGKVASVYAFVDLATGDVLKPASFRAPAKHARGNVLDASNGLQHMGQYGPAYLR